jgi:tRNA (Thr-GGU) A37 N-methylase
VSEVVYRPIGVVRSPFTALEGMPLQSVAAEDVRGTIEIGDLKPYVPAFDSIAAERIGWFAGKTDRVHEVKADGRFDDPR